MSKQINPTMVGGFVIGAVVLAVAVVILFGTVDLFSEKSTYAIFFRGSVNGLRVGAPVKLRGVDIGSVKSITAINDEAGNFYVEVIIETMNQRVRNPSGWLTEAPDKEVVEILIDKGMRAHLETQSMITGQLYIKLDYFPNTEVILSGLDSRYPEVPSIPSGRERFIEDLGTMLQTLSSIPFQEIAESIQSTMREVNKVMQTANFEETFAEIRAAVDQASEMVRHLDEEMIPAAESLRRTADAAAQALARVDTLLDQLDEMTEESDHSLKNSINDLAAAARSFRAFADYLERNPSSLIFGKKE